MELVLPFLFFFLFTKRCSPAILTLAEPLKLASLTVEAESESGLLERGKSACCIYGTRQNQYILARHNVCFAAFHYFTTLLRSWSKHVNVICMLFIQTVPSTKKSDTWHFVCFEWCLHLDWPDHGYTYSIAILLYLICIIWYRSRRNVEMDISKFMFYFLQLLECIFCHRLVNCVYGWSFPCFHCSLWYFFPLHCRKRRHWRKLHPAGQRNQKLVLTPTTETSIVTWSAPQLQKMQHIH